MSVLSKVERIDREIFRTGKFSIKSTVLTGKKNNSTNAKLDAVYNRTYNSQKYSNQSELTVTSISTSDFLVFAYNNFDANNKVNEEIFVSHPNMMDIKWFCNELWAMVSSNEVFNNNNTVNVKYQEHQVNSPALGGNKVLVAIPASIQKDQNATRGVYLFFNSEDNYVELDSRAIFTINEIIKNVDLLTLSNATLMLGMMANINSVGSEEDTYAPAPTNSLPPRGNFFSGRGNNNNSRFQTRNESVQQAPVVETNNAFGQNQQPQPQVQQETITPNTTGGSRFKKPGVTSNNSNTAGGGLPNRGGLNVNQQPSNNNVNPVTTGNDVLNMNNILNTANNIEFEPIEEGDIEF